MQVIPAITDREGYEKPKLRVCAYCRVSTDMDTQALSYELQVQNYTEDVYKRQEVYRPVTHWLPCKDSLSSFSGWTIAMALITKSDSSMRH